MEKDSYEIFQDMLKKIRFDCYDLINTMKKYDNSIDENDILSFVLERHPNKTLEEISRFKFRWAGIDFYRKFKIAKREYDVFFIIKPFIRCNLSVFDEKYLDLLVYKVDRNYKRYLDLSIITRSNGNIDSRKCNKLFNEILKELNLTEKDFYDLIESEMYKYKINSQNLEFKDEIYNDENGDDVDDR